MQPPVRILTLRNMTKLLTLTPEAAKRIWDRRPVCICKRFFLEWFFGMIAPECPQHGLDPTKRQ
jgi:hypothetical protein